jgi:Kdo2-lipid IVA lauroyltransferase/acyltransferase
MSRAATWLLLSIFRLLAFAPKWLVRAVSLTVGELAFMFARYRRGIALRNLALCFPDWSEQKRKDVARAHFRCYARAFIERFEVWSGTRARLEKEIQLHDLHHFSVHEPAPIIVLAPHFLGLDAGGVRFQIERRFVSLYSEQSNQELNDWTRRGRERFNDPILVSRQQGLSTAARWLKRGLPFYFLPDMDLGRRDAVFVPFFGVPAATVTSVVRLSRMMNAVVVPLVTRMTKDGYEARFYPGWRHSNDDQVETVEQGVRRMNAFIEARILEMPEQYLWTHRRFKTRPRGEPSLYA